MKGKTLTRGMIRKALEVVVDIPDEPLLIRLDGIDYTLTPSYNETHIVEYTNILGKRERLRVKADPNHPHHMIILEVLK